MHHELELSIRLEGPENLVLELVCGETGSFVNPSLKHLYCLNFVCMAISGRIAQITYKEPTMI
jgi:hypothetical protein